MPRKPAQKQKQKQKQRQSQRVVVNVGTAPAKRRAPRRKPAPKQSVEEAEYIASLNRVIPPVNIISPPSQPIMAPSASQPVPIMQPDIATSLADILRPEFVRMRAERQQAAERMQEDIDRAYAQRLQDKDEREKANALLTPVKPPPQLYRHRSTGSALPTKPYETPSFSQPKNAFALSSEDEDVPQLVEAAPIPTEAVVLSAEEIEAERKRVAEEAVRKAEADRKELARIRRADNKKAEELAKSMMRKPQQYHDFDVVDEDESEREAPVRRVIKVPRPTSSSVEFLTGNAQRPEGEKEVESRRKPRQKQDVVNQWFNQKSDIQPGL